MRADGPADSVVNFNGCSGTVISKGERYALILSAEHCAGRKDVTRSFTTPGGKSGTARAIATDYAKDLSLWKAWAKDVGEPVYVADKIEGEKFTAIGYPSANGYRQSVKGVEYSSPSGRGFAGMSGAMGPRTNGNGFTVRSGVHSGGDSGGGVFDDDGCLVGVITHGQGRGWIATARLGEIHQFIDETYPTWADDCPQCYREQAIGLARRPDRLHSDVKMAQAIMALEDRVAALEARVAELEHGTGDATAPAPIPPIELTDAEVRLMVAKAIQGMNLPGGQKGDKGDKGDPGAAGPAGKVTIIFKDKNGAELGRHNAVVSGSAVEVELERFLVTGGK